jgi:cytoskeletal protein CcmA (bactofilin family)
MKNIEKIIILLFVVLVITAAASGKALGAAPGARALVDQFVIGESYTLKSGNTLNGNLWVLGGNATIESGAQINGNIRMAGGNLHEFGAVYGNIFAAGGQVEIGSSAVINGNVNLTGASLDRSSSAVITGSVTNSSKGPFQVTPSNGNRIPNIQFGLAPLWKVIGFFFRTFLMAALAILVAMFWPKQTGRTAKTVTSQPLISGGLGLLTAVVTPLVALVMAVTILLIPVVILGLVLLGIMVAFGWISIGIEVGRRLEQAFKTEWALPVTAGLGTFVLTLVVDGIGQFVPCVGWLAPTAIGVMGLGAVLLTRFGSQDYPTFLTASGGPSGLVVPTEPVPPSTPVEPANPMELPSGTEPTQPEPPQN